MPKQDGSVRICGDFKGTINPTLQAEQYPLPRIEDIFAHLAGGKKFSKIDLRQAYHQIELEEESKKYLTINTSMGLFQYNRLVFGITSAPTIWKCTMDQILEGTSGISCILDDMIVMANLEEVLRRLHHHGLRANKSKCEFFKEKITFCGHDINSEGLHKTTDKTAAMVNAPRPQSVAEVRFFLGLVNYYHKFLPNLETQILESNYQWNWTDQCEEAFCKVKAMIVSDEAIKPFYQRKDELTVHCGVLMPGHRAVIPAKLRNQVLTELHEGHLGIVKMKSLARSYIWWPKIDKDIEHLAKSCPGCQLQQNEAGKVPLHLHPWEWPTTPWQRIHLDFAGPFLGRMFLIIVDAHSKWPEVEIMPSTEPWATIYIRRVPTIFED